MGKRIYRREQDNVKLAHRSLVRNVQPYFGHGVFWASRRGTVQTWADQETDAAMELLEAKKWLDWGSYQTQGGNGKL